MRSKRIKFFHYSHCNLYEPFLKFENSLFAYVNIFQYHLNATVEKIYIYMRNHCQNKMGLVMYSSDVRQQ